VLPKALFLISFTRHLASLEELTNGDMLLQLHQHESGGVGKTTCVNLATSLAKIMARVCL